MNIDTRTDAELVTALKRSRDEKAFKELVQRYTEKVHNLSIRITRNAEDAEEILQDVFVAVYEKIDKFKEQSAFSSWLYRITTNTAFMKLRKRKKNAAVSLDESTQSISDVWTGNRSDSCDLNYMTARHEMREALEEAISTLPRDYKLIFILRDVDGLSNQEVGEVLDLSVPAVKSRLHRARLMLRKKLKRFYEDYNNSEMIDYGPSAETTELYRQAA